MKILNKIKEYLANKKGQAFANLGALATGLVTLAIILVVVFLIMSQTAANSTVAADANASAAIDELQRSGDTLVNFVPIVVITAIGAILLGLVALFGGRRR